MRALWMVLALGSGLWGGCSDDADSAEPGAGRPGPSYAGSDGDSAGTGERGTGGGTGGPTLPETYRFDSAIEPGASSVSYSGQTFRHLLIERIKTHIDGLDERIAGGFVPAAGDVAQELVDWYEFDSSALGEQPLPMSTDPGLMQGDFNAVSSGKDLRGKFAGNDAATDHADWKTDFVGWGGEGNAEAVLFALFDELDAAAVARANGEAPLGVDVPVYVTAEGRDLQQLIQKLLLVAVTFSQGADDYLDDDVEGKGLLAAHRQDGEDAYTALEHAWDEGFGYFGAARDYGLYSDEALATSGMHYRDTDDSGDIDITSEYNFGASINAAKRDRGAVAATDYTGQAWDGFMRGRALIAAQAPADVLADDVLAELRAHRDAAVGAWERVLAATAVHYINDLLRDIAAYGKAEPPVADAAKHWSELKGFSLGLQFHRGSPLSAEDFAELQALVRTAPAMPGDADVDAFRADLVSARALLGRAYAFEADNLGDAEGEGGW